MIAYGGTRSMFEDAGFRVVGERLAGRTRWPRPVLRLDLEGPSGSPQASVRPLGEPAGRGLYVICRVADTVIRRVDAPPRRARLPAGAATARHSSSWEALQ